MSKRGLRSRRGLPSGWYKYVGLKGDVIGIDRFGASAPAKVLFEKFGFTIDNIVGRAKRCSRRNVSVTGGTIQRFFDK